MEESESNAYFARIVKTSAFMFILVMLSKVLGYAYKIVIARYFDAEVYGLFSLSMIVISIATSLAGVGLFEGLVRQISIYRGLKKDKSIVSLVTSSKNFLIINGFILFGLVFLSAPIISIKLFHEPRLIIFIQVMALAIPFLLIANLFLSVLRAHEKVKTQSTLTNIVQNSSKFFILLLFIFIGLSIASVPLSYLASSMILAVAAWFYARKILHTIKLPKTKNKSDRKMLIEVISYSWPLMFVGIITSIFYWTDSFTIGYYLNVREVGIYNAAITLVTFLGIIPELFIQLLFPIAALNLSRNKNIFVNSLIKRVAKWILCINSSIALACFIFAPQLIMLLFGEDFMSAVNSLRILSVGALFATLSAYFTNLLTIAAKAKKILVNLIGVTVLNLVLAIIMVPVIGMEGAAIATSISGFVLFLITLSQVKKFYTTSPLNKKSFIAIIGLLVLFIISLMFLKPYSIITTIFIGLMLLLTYLAILIFIGFFDKDDTDLFSKIFKKISHYSNWAS